MLNIIFAIQQQIQVQAKDVVSHWASDPAYHHLVDAARVPALIEVMAKIIEYYIVEFNTRDVSQLSEEVIHNLIVGSTDNPRCIGLAYTTVGDDEEHEVQFNLNVIDRRWFQLLDGEIVDTGSYSSDEAMLEDVSCYSFDTLVRLPDHVMEKLEGGD